MLGIKEMATATPQRPLPGTFINTPAPVRSSISSSKPPQFRFPSNSGLQRQISLSQPETAIQTSSFGSNLGPNSSRDQPLDRASFRINTALQQDRLFPAIDDYILQCTSSDYDHGNTEGWTPFERVKNYDIPDRVLEQLNNASTSIQIGLFAEIHHAWAVVDNVFYLWDYTHPNPELAGFDDVNSNITAVKLAKPRPGVFKAEISHVLLLSSLNEFFILGLSTTQSPEGVISVSLYQTDLKTPIKGLQVSKIAVSSKTGRIFVGLEDSNDIYEITYQNEEKWFSSKCGKINHTSKEFTQALTPSLSWAWNPTEKNPEHTIQMEIDDTRNLLYVLSNDSKFRIFHTKQANLLQLVITQDWKSTLNDISHMMTMKSSLIGPQQKIMTFSVIPDQESTRLAIMATLVTGVRIYFTLTSGHYSSSGGVPSSMKVFHMKFPPPKENVTSPSIQSQTNLLMSSNPAYGTYNSVDAQSLALNPTTKAQRFSPGYFIAVTSNNNVDTLYMSAPDSAKIAKPIASGTAKFIESGQWISLGNAQVQDIGLITPPFKAKSTPVGFGNELSVQYDQLSTEIAVITNMGTHVFKRNRLVDVFAALLKSCTTEEDFEEKVKKVIRDYSRNEICATALAVACGQAKGINIANDSMIIDLARRTFIEQGGSPDFQDVVDNSQSQIDSVRPSARTQSLVIYISRLLRSAWELKIIIESNVPGTGIRYTPTIAKDKRQSISQALINLKEFLLLNKTSIPGLSGPEEMNKVMSVPEQVALQAENRELDALIKLINNAIEGIAFLNQLFEGPIVDILLSLPENQRNEFKDLTYEKLFTWEGGKLLAKEVVKAIISRSIADGSNIDTVADTLRRRCGSFCSADDVVIFKAQEHLQRALDAGSETSTGRILLNDSLKLFEKVAGSLSTQYLQAAISQYLSMAFFAGAIQLCLSVAQQRDRANKALAWIRDGSPQNDSRKDFYDKRFLCYQEIWKIIKAVDSNQSGSSDQMIKRKAEAYVVIDESDDEVFQNCLFNWYLQNDLSSRLLDITSTYVISFLQRKSKDEKDIADLLWKYYTHHREFFQAADVQLQLAKSGFSIDLATRIEYLSRAKANASARTLGYGDSSGKRQSKIQEIQDLLDCSSIQLDTLKRLEQDPRLKENKQNVLMKLNGEILGLNEIYNDFVDPAGYHDISLIIYYLSDFRSEPEISAAWRNLIKDIDEGPGVSHVESHVLIQEKVRSLGRRVNASEIIFNPLIIIRLLLEYMFDDQTKAERIYSSREWPVDIVMDVGVTAETVLSVLETLQMHEAESWSISKRRTLASLSVYVAHKWLQDSILGGGLPFGGDEGLEAVVELLRNLSSMQILTGRDADTLRDLLSTVERIRLN